jgi:ribosome-binding factor A
MPEHRAREHHRNRLAETLREEIAIIIEGELNDPRIGSTTVTEVALAPGGKSGHVYVAVVGTEEEEDATLEGLVAARGYIRSQLLERMGVRHLPDLAFHIDRSERLSARMDQILTRVAKRTGKSKARQTKEDAAKVAAAKVAEQEAILATVKVLAKADAYSEKNLIRKPGKKSADKTER